jgi:hypothetical protein
VIAFGIALPEGKAYSAYTEPGIRLASEPDSEILAVAAMASTTRVHNLLLEQAAALDGLEALVLLHPHTEITDRDFAAKIRAALAEPGVDVVGCAGANGVRGPDWWEGSVVSGPVRLRYQEHAGGEIPAYGWADPAPAPGEVEVVDRFLMALSPRAVRELRFDERLWLTPGFEVDFCRRVRDSGGRVMVADLEVVQHRALDLVGDSEAWMLACLEYSRITAEAEDDESVDWRSRALRAEADRDAARILTYFSGLVVDHMIAEREAQLEALTSAPGWALTAPLRRLNHRRRERRR